LRIKRRYIMDVQLKRKPDRKESKRRWDPYTFASRILDSSRLRTVILGWRESPF
jgi:hypothetical protein